MLSSSFSSPCPSSRFPIIVLLSVSAFEIHSFTLSSRISNTKFLLYFPRSPWTKFIHLSLDRLKDFIHYFCGKFPPPPYYLSRVFDHKCSLHDFIVFRIDIKSSRILSWEIWSLVTDTHTRTRVAQCRHTSVCLVSILLCRIKVNRSKNSLRFNDNTFQICLEYTMNYHPIISC